MLSIRFAFSSLISRASVASFAALAVLSVGCSSSDSPGSSGSSGGGTGTASGSSGTGTGSTGSGTGSTGTGTGSTGSGTGSSGSAGTVSFSTAIIPIFQANCSTDGVACHGDPSVTTQSMEERPYLGPSSGTTPPQSTLTTILTGLMAKSAEDTTMPLVTPGSDTNSYLMHKLDNTLTGLDCSKGDFGGTCGLAMPYTASMLPQTTRDTIRAWINAGAPNN